MIPPAELVRATQVFAHHPPKSSEVGRLHAHVRDVHRGVYLELLRVLPDTPERTRALDALDDACKHANAAVARYLNEPDAPTPVLQDPRCTCAVPLGADPRDLAEVDVYPDCPLHGASPAAATSIA